MRPATPACEADIPTPYLRLNADRVHRNIQRLADYARKHDLKVRPHTKTHKSLRLAKLQLAAGAVGLTVAKVGEAQVMAEAVDAEAGLLLAYPTVDAHRAKQVAQLAGGHRVLVALDSTQAVDALAETTQQAGHCVEVLVDLDVGMGRTGVADVGKARELARYVDGRSHLRLAGLFCYPGHVLSPLSQQAEALKPMARRLEQAIQCFEQDGLCCNIVSGGSTPTAYGSHHVPQLTEIRPGTYIFNDMNTVDGGYCDLQDCAACINTTVISEAVAGQVVVDAGSKTLTSDLRLGDVQAGFGYVVNYPEARIARLTEEHGQIDITACDPPPRIGERLAIIPNHICPCVNLQDVIWWDSGEELLEPLPVDARGKLS